MMTTAMNQALQGVQSNQRLFLESVRGISRAMGPLDSPGSGEGLLSSTVGILTSRRGMEANLSVLKVEDEMLGTLIDTLA
jgi:hypothetical protein